MPFRRRYRKAPYRRRKAYMYRKRRGTAYKTKRTSYDGVYYARCHSSFACNWSFANGWAGSSPSWCSYPGANIPGHPSLINAPEFVRYADVFQEYKVRGIRMRWAPRTDVSQAAVSKIMYQGHIATSLTAPWNLNNNAAVLTAGMQECTDYK